jgi:hypothetical protein
LTIEVRDASAKRRTKGVLRASYGLLTLTSAETGLARPDAERRVDTIITQAHDDIRKARRAAVILAFMAGAAALLGAAVAWLASSGGRHRDGTAPSTTWGWLGPHLAR